MKQKEINIRELQHNLSMYIDLAKADPLTVTRKGTPEILLVNPKKYKLTKMKDKSNEKSKKILSNKFIGMHKDRTDWKNKTAKEIADNLRESAWNGE